MVRKNYAGAAEALALASSITASDTAFTSSATPSAQWPTATFVVVLDRGLSTEEKILVGARSSTAFSSLTRGYDGTTAAIHSSASPVEHVLDADTLTDLAVFTYDTLTTKGDLFAQGSDLALKPSRLAAGADKSVLSALASEATGLKWLTSAALLGDLLVFNYGASDADLALTSTYASAVALSVTIPANWTTADVYVLGVFLAEADLDASGSNFRFRTTFDSTVFAEWITIGDVTIGDTRQVVTLERKTGVTPGAKTGVIEAKSLTNGTWTVSSRRGFTLAVRTA